jgi:capsular exopolysaccharide synthesis family protein
MEVSAMDLSKIFNILYRYLWLFALTVLVTSLTTFFLLNNQTPSYKATTQLLVGPSLDSPSPDLNALRIGGQLIMTYSELVGTRSFLESVNNKLENKMDLAALGQAISTRQNTETRVLTITVFHADPKQAVAIANAAAQTFVEMSPSKDNTTELLRLQMSAQSQQLEEIVSKAETTIQQLELELIELKGARTTTPEAVSANLERQNLIIQQLSDERARMSDALRTLATIYEVLLDSDTNQVAVLEPARAVVPVGQNLVLRMASAAVSGLVLALVIIFAIEFVDDRIRVSADLTRASGAPMLSTIDRHPRLDGSGLERLIAVAQPESRAANDYREVVAKLLFSMGQSMPYTLLLTSVGSQSGDDTAVTVANLAIEFAQAGKRVGLMDAQFHNPVLTKLFEADKKEGLSDVLVESSIQPQFVSLQDFSNVRYLPAGLSTDKASVRIQNPEKITLLLEELQKEVDIVLIAGSPISWFAESLALASQANAVILIARQGEAQSQKVKKVVEDLRGMEVQIAGVIFDQNVASLDVNRNVNKGPAAEGFGAKAARFKGFRTTGAVDKKNVSEQTTKS